MECLWFCGFSSALTNTGEIAGGADSMRGSHLNNDAILINVDDLALLFGIGEHDLGADGDITTGRILELEGLLLGLNIRIVGIFSIGGMKCNLTESAHPLI